MKVKKIVQISFLSCLILCGCSSPKEESKTPNETNTKELKEYSNMAFDAGFDTIYSYKEYGYDEELMRKHFDIGVELFSSYNNYFDIYNDYEGVNNLKAINDSAGKEAIKVDQEVIDLLKEAKLFYDLSDGAFDITMGAVLKVWHKYRDQGIALNEENKKGPIPSEEELEKANACKGWDKVEINEEEKTVYINDPCVSLDVGGIAKGYAAEQIGQEILKTDVEYASVNAGRNIRTLKTKPNNQPWRIGIANPSGEDSMLIMESITENSFVTSGDYERYYIGEDDKLYHHIIDPKTLFPSTYYHSVSIMTLDSGAADCLSTTLFSLTVAEGKEVLKRYTEETGNAASAVWIMDKDKAQDCLGKEMDQYFIAYTEDMEDKLEWKKS